MSVPVGGSRPLISDGEPGPPDPPVPFHWRPFRSLRYHGGAASTFRGHETDLGASLPPWLAARLFCVGAAERNAARREG